MHETDLLRQTINTIHPLPDEDWVLFSEHWKKISFRRKQPVTVAGSGEKHLYFILEGVQRIYSLDENDREATLVFTYPPSFGGIIDSLLLQQPSRYFYETLTASQFLRIAFSDLEKLVQNRPAIALFVQKALVLALSGLLERLAEVQSLSSEEKFRRLLRRSPHMLQLVPQKYLANYLGIDSTNFSKLINSVRI